MPRKPKRTTSARTLADLSAVEAAGALRTGEISAVDYVGACLERIAERDAKIEAWAYLDREHALAQARAADEHRRAGRPLGALHGLPIGIKDIIDTADMPTENGTVLDAGRRPERDAACVAALRAAGAVIMGKTMTTELANTHPGKTRNPHDPSRTPGGSSSGSAAAVASGMVPLALGTQTGGSVIRPASFCGIFALKPTFGLISRAGVTLQSHTLDTVGVYGRSIEDLGLVTDALSAHDPSDPVSRPRSPGSLLELARSEPPVAPLLAFLRTPAWGQGEAVTKDAFGELIEALGKSVREIELPSPFERICDLHLTVMNAEDAAYYARYMERGVGKLSQRLRERLESGAAITAKDYIAAVAAREPLYAMIERVLMDYEAILCPASAGPAPKGLASTGNPIFNGLWTYLGVPCVSLPLLEADGMPLGVQLVGSRGNDGRLLRTARWLVRRLRGEG
jgi:Asp-tRNA(Asn)/Glu-tRNA(Gln) amidotransferase A subunit family amidase